MMVMPVSSRHRVAIGLSVVFWAVTASQPRQARAGRSTAKGQSSISITIPADPKDGVTTIHRVNRTYDAIERPSREVLLLDQTIETNGGPSFGNSVAHVLLKTSTVSARGTRPGFTIDAEGSLATRSDDNALFIVSDIACCGAKDTHAVFSLANGRQLFFTGGQGTPSILSLESGVDRFYVGVHASGSHRDSDVYGNYQQKKNGALLISLASPTEPKDVLLLTSGLSPAQTYPVAVQWQSAPGSPESTRSKRVGANDTASVEVLLTSSAAVRIPIRDGRFLVESATLPAGCRLQHVDLK
jgi:hypothetical protein